MPYTLLAPCHSELIIKKSRFLGCVQAVHSREEALQIVQALRAEHAKAAHVCWALMAGGQSAAADDGEPSGTAGRPMLEVLRHQDLQGVLATVVRYFGGVKLGAGGLVRAYTDAVAQALLTASKQPSITLTELRFACDYAQEGLVRRALNSGGSGGGGSHSDSGAGDDTGHGGVQLLAVQHDQRVHWHVRLPQALASDWLQQLAAQCHGSLTVLDEVPPAD